MSHSKQHPRVRLHAQQEMEPHRAEEQRLAASFLAMVGALKTRPHPRHWWDNVASPDRVAYKGHHAVHAGRVAMCAALDTGSHDIIEDTATRVARFFDDMKDVALATYRALAAGHISLDEARIRAVKETTGALNAILQSAILRDEPCGFTEHELTEAIEGLVALRAQMQAKRAAPGPINRRLREGLAS